MQYVGHILLDIVYIFLEAYVIVILVNVLLSWFMPPTSSIKQFLNFLTEPVVAPIRNLMAPLTAKSTIPLDLSPLVTILLIKIISQIIWQLK